MAFVPLHYPLRTLFRPVPIKRWFVRIGVQVLRLLDLDSRRLSILEFRLLLGMVEVVEVRRVRELSV